MSRVTVIGGHGKVAQLLIPLLVADGDEVTAWVRNPDHEERMAELGAHAEVVDLEHADVPRMTELLTGQDAVVWSAGAGGGNPARTYAIDRDAAIRSMQAAMHASCLRYVMVSWYGSRVDHGVPEGDPFHAYARAKAAADVHLSGTDLSWTILGPSRLTDEPGTGTIALDDPLGKGEVPRADVAATIRAVLGTDSTIRASIAFNTGPTPIPEVLAAATSA